jgi:hypothetical protein
LKLGYECKILSENERLVKAWEAFDKELQFQNFDGFSRAALFALFHQAYIHMANK